MKAISFFILSFFFVNFSCKSVAVQNTYLQYPLYKVWVF